MSDSYYKSCSGLRLVLPFAIILFVYCMIDIVELLSPFVGYGDRVGYYELSSIYAFFGAPLLLALSLLRYEVSFSSLFLLSVSRLGRWALLLSFVGLCFLIFDRIFIQGVDYSQGVSAARENWREISISRGGVSSVFSVLGNLMYPMVFMAFSIFLIFYSFLSAATLKIFFCFLLVFGFSVLIGGRTSILILLCSVLGGCVVRCALGFELLPHKLIKWSLFLIFASFSFSSLIFYWRMSGSSVSFDSYAMSLVSRHNAYVVNDVRDVSVFDALMYSLIVYFVHVKWTFQVVLSDVSLHGVSFFNQIIWILSSRSGFDFGVDFNWTYSGRWISLPGSVWHDYGTVGVFLASFIMYAVSFLFMLGFVVFRKISNELKLSLIAASVVFFMFFVVSPFSSILEVVEFIYLCFGSLIVVIWCGLRGFLKEFST